MPEISSLLYQLKITEQKMTQLFEKRLHISLTRYEILQILLKESPCSQIALQKSLQIDLAAITRHLRQVEESGYITRRRNPENQREMLVELTDKAYEDLVVSPPPYHLQVKEEMAHILSKGEAATLQTLLEKMMHGLETITVEKNTN